MKPVAPLRVENLGASSVLETLAQRLYRARIPPHLICVVLALALTAAAGWFAIRLSRDYYAVAPYHYDSAYYRIQAVQFRQMLNSGSLRHAVQQSLQTKDSLDLSLRLVLAPQFLLKRFGHLAVLLPYMSVFLMLAVWYVFIRTGSVLLGVAPVAFLFTFPLIYGPYGAPYIGGIADFWKDNLATWLLGSATMAWLLSNNLAERRWSFLSGLLLALLVMQRAVAAVYAGALFLPLLLWAIYWRLRQDGVSRAFARVGAFVAPATLLGGLLIVLQFRQLYNYYFVAGYAYGTPVLATWYLANGLMYGGMLTVVLALGGVYLACLMCVSQWRRQIGDILVAGWLVVGLPLVVILTSAFYFGFYPLWTVLLIALLATLIPRTLTQVFRRMFAVLLLGVALFLSAVQYHISTEQARQIGERSAPTRAFYQYLVHVIKQQSSTYDYALFFDEVDYPFMNQAFFDNGLLLNPSVVLISVHDSYYHAAYGDKPSQQIVESNIHALEQHPGMLAVAHCVPEDVLKQPTFLSDGTKTAAPVAAAMGAYLLHSPRWQATNKLASPYGCLYVYRYAGQTLSATEKWQGLASYAALLEIPLTLPVAPSVRLDGYISRYQPEAANGNYYQWLPSGAAGLRLSLYSDQPRTVVLQAHVAPGPARKDLSRTLVVSYSQKDVPIQINGEQDIAVKLDLQPGLNHVELSVKEAADSSIPSGGDTRELMLALISPRLVPGANEYYKAESR